MLNAMPCSFFSEVLFEKTKSTTCTCNNTQGKREMALHYRATAERDGQRLARERWLEIDN